jgi:replicative DNA helicase
MADPVPLEARTQGSAGETIPEPVHNLEAEMALLGAILVSNAAFHRVADFLRPEHFAQGVHARIYQAIATLVSRGEVANPVTLKKLFDQDQALAEIGGSAYLVRLATSAVTIVNVPDYGATIAACWQRRQLSAIGADLQERAQIWSLDSSVDDVVAQVEEQFHDILSARPGARGPAPLGEAIDEALASADRVYKANGELIGVPTGLIDIDRALGGLQRGDLIIVAGRPGMGKTALATTIATGAAKAGRVVLFFSLEMSREELARRILAAEAGVSAERQRQGPLGEDHIAELVQKGSSAKALGFQIDDEASASVIQLRSRAIRLQRRQGLDLIVVDYLQLLVAVGSENRTQEISKITRDLKVLAKDLRVPVVALSQLNREVEKREDKRPMLADLRESGSIEQDADIVMFCYREEYYHAKREPPPSTPLEKQDEWARQMAQVRNLAELIIAKNRHGAERSIRLRFDGERTVFQDLDLRERAPT